MSIVVLDTGPLGMIIHPGGEPEVDACQDWFDDLLAKKQRIVLPEIADYEVRRELARLRKTTSLQILDTLTKTLEYLPLTTNAIRTAAQFWAQARQRGKPTADPQALDGDVILAAQSVMLGEPDVVVATTNVVHLSLFVTAKPWRDI